MTEPQSVLIIEDDPELSFCLRDNLEQEGYGVSVAADGKRGLELALRQRFDLVLLDLMLPEIDGLSVCREIRGSGKNTAIIVISAKGDEVDKVIGLELGADDYVAKPFGLREILARVRAVLRRSPSEPPQNVVRLGDCEVYFRRQEIHSPSEVHRLSYLETEILAYLVQHSGAVVSRAELYEAVWGEPTHTADRSVDHHIVRLRRILESNPKSPRIILTVYGTGYRLVLEPKSS
ncbi:MAG: response regulator transcription factor [Planctomycetota bacterium]